MVAYHMTHGKVTEGHGLTTVQSWGKGCTGPIRLSLVETPRFILQQMADTQQVAQIAVML